MESTYKSIIESRIIKFVVGSHKKECSVHAAAISELSKPLKVLLDGPHKEAQESRVEWPDVDEQTFVRFIQWAYTKNYVTEEPYIVLGGSEIELPSPSNDVSDNEKGSGRVKMPEQAMYSIQSLGQPPYSANRGHWGNSSCTRYGQTEQSTSKKQIPVTCLVCRTMYKTKTCFSCGSAWSDCQQCEQLRGIEREVCSNNSCSWYHSSDCLETFRQTCLLCQKSYSGTCCSQCCSALWDCPTCYKTRPSTKRDSLIERFLDKNGTTYFTETPVFQPRKNTESCEEYTGVFLCHAQLYILGDTYDIPQLCQLSLHRLHATLKEFTLYPSRLGDIATMAKYVFHNTRSQDKIQDMIAHYYACIIEDTSKHEGLKSLIDEIPDFAFNLISRMSERLA